MQSTLPTGAAAALADSDLLATVKRLAQHERAATAALVAALAELDARRLYLGEGCSSLFVYCTRVLCLSEHAAYHRIEAARVARRFPLVVERLAAGSLTLTTVTLLAPLLTPDNHHAVLDAAHHKSKREVEQQVSELAPRPDVPACIRKLPSGRTEPMPATATASPASRSGAVSLLSAAGRESLARASETPAATMPAVVRGGADTGPPIVADATSTDPATVVRGPAPGPVDTATPSVRRGHPVRERALITPLAPARYRVQMTLGGHTVEKLRRAQDLMRHTIPDGDPAAIVDRALTLLLNHLARTRLAATERPRPNRPSPATRSRHVPAAVRRAVWARDEGRSTFAGAEGRCAETGVLELHHLEPYALGGATTVEGLALRCRAHNRYEAEREFGVLEFDAAAVPGAGRHAPMETEGNLRWQVRSRDPWLLRDGLTGVFQFKVGLSINETARRIALTAHFVDDDPLVGPATVADECFQEP